MVCFGIIKTNAISHLSFPTSTWAQTWERVVDCVFMIVHSWNHMTAGRKSRDPHVALADVSNRPTSVERSEKLLMLSRSVMEEKEPVS